MDNNFMIEITMDDRTLTLDADSLDINIYQKCNDKDVRVMEIDTHWENTDPGGHQLNLRAIVPVDARESGDIDIDTDALSNVLSIYSYKYGKGQ